MIERLIRLCVVLLLFMSLPSCTPTRSISSSALDSTKAPSQLAMDQVEEVQPLNEKPSATLVIPDCETIQDHKTASCRRFFIATNSVTPEVWEEASGALPDELQSSASLWSNLDVLVRSDMELSSPSGDWYQTLRYCFRANGSLETMHESLSTHHGRVTVVTVRQFDLAGRKVDSKTEFFSLDSGQPIEMEEGGYMAQPAPVYPEAEALKKALGFPR